ncbi:hypothetical protein ACFX1S_014152 [Malus domestica]
MRSKVRPVLPKLFGNPPLLSPTSFKSFIYRALASKASFTELQLLQKLHLQSFSFFKSFIFIYRALASKASFTELQLQTFTCKASPTKLQCRVYKYRIRTNHHFDPYMDSI